MDENTFVSVQHYPIHTCSQEITVIHLANEINKKDNSLKY